MKRVMATLKLNINLTLWLGVLYLSMQAHVVLQLVWGGWDAVCSILKIQSLYVLLL